MPDRSRFDFLKILLTDQAAAWVVHVASLAKRSKGATQSIGGTVIDGVLLDGARLHPDAPPSRHEPHRHRHRPVDGGQPEDRVEGHIFISVLAYQLLRWVEHRLGQSGDVRDWQTVPRLLRTHSADT